MSTRASALVVLLGLAAIAVHVGHPDGLIGDLTYVGVAGGVAVAAWVGARRSRPDPLATMIAVGLTLSASGDVIYQLDEWGDGYGPEVSIADAMWVGAYVAIAGALLALLRRAGRRRLDLDGLIDIAAIAVLATVLQWALFLGDLVTDASVAVFPRVVWCLYPLLDAVLLALVVRAATSRRLAGRTARLTAAGVFAWLLADVLFATLEPGATVSVWLDAGWLVGGLALAAATWVPSGLAPAETDVVPDLAVSRVPVAIALVPLAIPPLLEIVGFAHGTDPNPVPLFGVTMLLLGVAYVRAMRAQRAEADARSTARTVASYASALAMNASDAVAVLDADGHIQNDEERLAAMVGRSGLSPKGVDAFSLVAEADVEDARAIFSEYGTAGPFRILRGLSTMRRTEPHTEGAGRVDPCSP